MAASGRLMARRRPLRADRTIRRLVFYALVVLVCAVVLFPIYWTILSAIQPARFSMHYPPPFFPQAISLTPFQQLFDNYPVLTWVTNSTVISLLTSALCVALGIFG